MQQQTGLPDFSGVTGGAENRPDNPQSQRTYTVQRGDSLSKIAKEYYGDANQWHKIHEANRDKIKDPNLIQPGWTLIIP